MAGNRSRVHGRQIAMLVTDGGVASGDPCLSGQLPGVALGPKDGSNIAVMDVAGVYQLSVKGIDGGGNSAVAPGDIIYYVTADTPKLSKKATGVRFGYAVGKVNPLVASAGTATIDVKIGV